MANRPSWRDRLVSSDGQCSTMESPTDEHGFTGDPPKPRALPDDLPRSLDDRRNVPMIGEETEMYDAWQGEGSARVSDSLVDTI